MPLTGQRKPERSKDQQLSERAQIAHWLAQGKAQWEIRDLFAQEGTPRHPSTINRDVQAIRQAWWEGLHRDLDQWIMEKLAEIRALKDEYWGAWQASKGKHARATLGRVVNARQEMSEHISSVEEVSHGDPRYLEGVERCIAQECRLLGLNAPIQIETFVRWEIKRISEEYGIPEAEVEQQAWQVLRGGA